MVSIDGHGIDAAVGLRERLVREGWVISSRDPGRTYWRSPAHPGLVVGSPDPSRVLDVEHFCRGEHEFLDSLALDAMPTSLKLAAPDLLEALVMVRDADEDCLKDSLPRWCTPAARARIDRAIAKAKGEQP